MLAYRIFDPVKTTTPADLTPQIATRAYGLYEQRGRRDGQAAQDWEKAEREIRNNDSKSEQKPEPTTPEKSQTTAESETKAKAEIKTESQVGSRFETNAECKPETKHEIPVDLNPQIAKRAYELYEEQGHKNGRSIQDWEKAEQEIQNNESKVEPQPEADVDPKTEPETRTEPKSEANAETKPDDKVKPKDETKARTPADLTPGLVKRVHELYEKLGREDVQAVEEWEKTERETRNDEIKADDGSGDQAKTKTEDKK